MCGNCCSRMGQKLSDWDPFGRKQRHNNEGKGPSQKVFDPTPSVVNRDTNVNQTEIYNDPNKNHAMNPEFNPFALTIVPKVEEKTINTSDPSADQTQLEGSIKYNPGTSPIRNKEEDQLSKNKRLEEERQKMKKEIEEINKRTEDDAKNLVDKVSQKVENEHTNNKPIVPPVPKTDDVKGNQILSADKGIQQDKEALIAKDNRKINGLNLASLDVFEEGKSNQANSASHQLVIENSDWSTVHQQINGEFYDKDFPAEIKSVIGDGKYSSNEDEEKIKTMSTYGFKRLSYILKEVEVIKDGIMPNDIYQGGLGDCYYLSSLAALAEFPERIVRLIFQKTTSQKGAYCIALCITGQWTTYVLDDIFPVKKDGTLPFCYSKNKEIWAMLLEKAYAKAYGSYWSIGQGGMSNDALKDLTGAPCIYIDLEKPDDEAGALKNIIEGDKLNFIITCSSKGQGESKNPKGIIEGHAYTLVGAIKMSNGVNVLKLRNPWGQGEWKGDWSDESSLWNDKLKREAGWTNIDDGTFYMTYPDLLENFCALSICHYYDDFLYSSTRLNAKDEETTVMQFTINQEGSYYIGLSQPDKKMFGNSVNYQQGYLSCIILRKDGDSLSYVDGFANATRDIWSKMKLNNGSYLALIYTNWNSVNTQFGFWTYGPKNVPIKKVTKESNIASAKESLYQAFLKSTFAKPENWNCLKKTPALEKIRYKFEYGTCGYGCYLFDNQSENIKLVASLKLAGDGCQIIKPDINDGKYELTLSPGETKMAFYRITNLPNSVNFSVSFRMSSI